MQTAMDISPDDDHHHMKTMLRINPPKSTCRPPTMLVPEFVNFRLLLPDTFFLYQSGSECSNSRASEDAARWSTMSADWIEVGMA